MSDLETFLNFADKIQDAYERANRPAYAETCSCGGTIAIDRSVPPVERRRMWTHFQGRHRDCAVRPVEGQL